MTSSLSNPPPPDDTRAAAGRVPETLARPGTVTAAAVLGLIWGGLTIVSSLVSMVGGSILKHTGSACAPNDQSGLCAFVADSSGLLVVIGSALIVAAALVIWGSIAARNGKNAKVLVIASGIQILVQVGWMIETGSIAFGIVGVIIPIGIIGLIVSSASRTWFQARDGATF